jgi:hypothetical protein
MALERMYLNSVDPFSMKVRLLIVIAVGVAVSLPFCREIRGPASSAVASEFDGSWRAVWSWDNTKTTTLDITGGSVRAVGFPIILDGTVKAVNAEGKADFQPEYGPRGHPCMLIGLPGAGMDVAIFISADKEKLLYFADTNRDWKLEFSR